MAVEGFGERRAIGSFSYREVRVAAARVANQIERGQREQCTTLATFLPSGEHLPLALFGAALGEVSYAPLNFRLPQLAQAELLKRVQPAVLFEDLGTDGESDHGGRQDDAWRETPEETESPAVILFTSGTSASPKSAVLSHGNLLTYLFNTLEFASADEDEAVLLAVPPFHIAGVAAILSSTFVGRRIIPLADFSASKWLETAQSEAITHAMMVPTMLARIVDELDKHPELKPKSLRTLSYGGAQMPLSLLERALELFPDTDFVNAYGLTETASTVAVLGPEDHRDAFHSSDPTVRRRLQSCGRPVPGIEFRVHEGEVLIRGPQVSGAYADAESRVDEDGWLHTGDAGLIDDAGYVFLTGRADDVIIRGGENISPTEIEDAILRIPGVLAAAVVALPDPEWGHAIGAMVVLSDRGGLEVSQLRDDLKKKLGSLKTPEIFVLADELPTTATGKVLRREIRELIGTQHGTVQAS
jgi:acyl-CoA synthetase (AMP-forming)/AMP-acid ligase II